MTVRPEKTRWTQELYPANFRQSQIAAELWMYGWRWFKSHQIVLEEEEKEEEEDEEGGEGEGEREEEEKDIEEEDKLSEEKDNLEKGESLRRRGLHTTRN